jgi:hypothetical protein
VLLLLLACIEPDVVIDLDSATSASDSGALDSTVAFTDCSTLVWYEGDLILQYQSDVAGFCSAHNAIRGDLSIDVSNNEDTITELDGIGCLCEVDGDLLLTSTDDPAAPPPPHITGDLELGLLERIGGDLLLINLPLLTYLQELWALREVGGDIVIDGCPDLQYSSLYTLESVGGSITLRNLGKLLVFRLPSLTTAHSITLGSPGDGESLYFLAELALTSLTTLSGDLSLTGTRNLGLLSAPVLTDIDGALHIEAACSLRPSLPVLEELGSLHIEGACGVSDFAGLPALTALTSADDDGYSFWLSASEAVDDKEVSDFLGSLKPPPPGEVFTDSTTTCADVLSAYGETFCE